MSATCFRALLTLVVATSAVVGECHADPLHAISHGTYWHHDSGWLFPEKIGEFVRVGAPQDVGESKDVVAHYVRGDGESRATVVIDIYPPDSALGETTFAAAKAALERELVAQLRSEGPFRLGAQGDLLASKASFTARRNGSDAHANLYFVAAADWRIKLRLVADASDTRSIEQMDAFVRSQTWDRLGDPEPPCLHAGCKAE